MHAVRVFKRLTNPIACDCGCELPLIEMQSYYGPFETAEAAEDFAFRVRCEGLICDPVEFDESEIEA